MFPRLKTRINCLFLLEGIFTCISPVRVLAEPPNAMSPVAVNGDFEIDADNDGWPDGWPDLSQEGGEWLSEDGKRFVRLHNPESDKSIRLYRDIPIPVGIEAIEVLIRWRVSDLKPGTMPWHDARVIIDIRDAAGNKLTPQPPPVFTQHGTAGQWINQTVEFIIPENGVSLEVMPGLYEVQSGTLDLDTMIIQPIDSTPLLEAQKAKNEARAKARVPREVAKPHAWPSELKTSGNQLVDREGSEVWLQGLNPSLTIRP